MSHSLEGHRIAAAWLVLLFFYGGRSRATEYIASHLRASLCFYPIRPARSIDAAFPPDAMDKTADDERQLPWASGGCMNLTAGGARIGGPAGGAGEGGASVEAGREVKLSG